MASILQSFLGRFAIGATAVMLIAVLIWYAGPLLEMSGYAPLQSEEARLILIGVVILIFALIMLWQWLRARRAQLAAMFQTDAEGDQGRTRTMHKNDDSLNGALTGIALAAATHWAYSSLESAAASLL